MNSVFCKKALTDGSKDISCKKGTGAGLKAIARTGQEGHEPVSKVVGGVSIRTGAVIATPRKAGEMNAELKSRVENWQSFVTYLSVGTCDRGLLQVREEHFFPDHPSCLHRVDLRVVVNFVPDLRGQAEERKRLLQE